MNRSPGELELLEQKEELRRAYEDLEKSQTAAQARSRELRTLNEKYQSAIAELNRIRTDLEMRNQDLSTANHRALRFQEELGKGLEKLRANGEKLAQALEQVRQINEELSQFAHIVSHDLQEPLRTIGSYAQLLAHRYTGRLGGDADAFIGFVTDGVRRMSELIRDLRLYTQVSEDEACPEQIDCAAVVQDVLADLAQVIQERRAVIEVGPLPTAQANRRLLGSVFNNLITNAIKFSVARPRIKIAAKRRDASWVFSVKDNGIGIDPKHHERIFTIFKRLHTRAQYPGTGAGLAICAKIISHRGGNIWVESVPGKGSTFYFTLPLSSDKLEQ